MLSNCNGCSIVSICLAVTTWCFLGTLRREWFPHFIHQIYIHRGWCTLFRNIGRESNVPLYLWKIRVPITLWRSLKILILFSFNFFLCFNCIYLQYHIDRHGEWSSMNFKAWNQGKMSTERKVQSPCVIMGFIIQPGCGIIFHEMNVLNFIQHFYSEIRAIQYR